MVMTKKRCNYLRRKMRYGLNHKWYCLARGYARQASGCAWTKTPLGKRQADRAARLCK